MNKWKKVCAGIVAVCLMTAGFAGCSNSNEKDGASPSASPVADGNEPIDEPVESPASAEGSTGGTLIMATEAGFAPYEYYEGENIVGVDVDIAKEIAKAMGKELEILDMDFDSIIPSVDAGKADFGAAGISINEERKQQVDFTIEYAVSNQVVVVKKDAGKLSSLDDLADKVIGVQQGTTADFYLADTYPENESNMKYYTKYLQAAEDLKNDKIDCIVMDELPAQQMAAANDSLAIMDGILFTDKYAFAVKKGNAELLEELNAILQGLVDDGKIDAFTIAHATK